MNIIHKIVIVITCALVCVAFAWNHNDRVHKIPIEKTASITMPHTLSFTQVESNPFWSLGWNDSQIRISLENFMAKKKGEAFYHIVQRSIQFYTIEGTKFWIAEWEATGSDIISTRLTDSTIDVYQYVGGYDWTSDIIAIVFGIAAIFALCIPSRD